MRKPFAIAAGTVAAALVLATTSCVSTGVDSYADFRGAVDSGATCEQLFDMRSNFDDRPSVQDEVDSDLAEIGCEDADSERTDE
ncbi:MAG TPA: hypothetical protein VEV43_12210 [Actinomycetota bacterium]|nr:hypothetical protein [Actinomycetota bacterium]